MAYMNQEKKKIIAEKMKPILKKYGVKGSLSVRNHMSIALKLKEGKIDFLSDYKNAGSWEKGHIQVNPYWYHEHFTGKSVKFFEEAIQALKSANWYDNSDSQIDYFDTAYYYDITVGAWDKPYQVLEA